MISPQFLFQALDRVGISFYTGVPDSLLKYFCAYVTDNVEGYNHILAANEGSAVGIALGYFMSTGRVPVVYMQNSGLGNTVNPLMSLADKEVYSVPMLMLIGWRGEPGKKDEPQHVKQGRVILQMLDVMEIPYSIIDGSSESQALDAIEKSRVYFRENDAPYAIVVKNGTFQNYAPKLKRDLFFNLSREKAIETILDSSNDDDIFVSTTGMASRELFELREARNQSHSHDFLTVGGMGHASQIAIGIATQKIDRRVICIDGDGAAIMHMGALAINCSLGLSNFKHVILNNGAHDSVGGQPTVGFKINFPEIARAVGYKSVFHCESYEQLEKIVPEFLNSNEASLLEVFIDIGNRKDLGRPTITPIENKLAFMNSLRNSV